VIHTGDCVKVMAGMEAASIDAIVTDPPYDLVTASRNGSRRVNESHGPFARHGGFMGKEWDATGVAFRPETWSAALRVAKPGAYLLAFGGTRTYHRMTVAIEDAGWIIRDCLVWAYAQGFPKSKALLKPAWEPIVMARKPGPLRPLAIDECRIGPPLTPEEIARSGGEMGVSDGRGVYGIGTRRPAQSEGGRWPANVILTDPIFDGDVPGVVGGGETTSGKMMPTAVRSGDRTVFGSDAATGYTTIETYGDSGTYSRFFLIPKASRSEREMGLPAKNGERANHHPTVKPLALMRHLVRLVTPTGGVVLDPFLGSGTTGMAAEIEGFDWIGIEREAEYVAIAEARLNGVQTGMGLQLDIG
jgi:site-specific DNA-methyltransferase (adenine-specific)